MDDGRSLYRREALEFGSNQSLGQPTVVQPLSLRVLTVFVLGLCVLAGTFLYFGEYARKTTVVGYLEPERGFVRVFPNSNGGVIRELLVEDGQFVEAGTPLAEVAFPTTLLEGQEVRTC